MNLSLLFIPAVVMLSPVAILVIFLYYRAAMTKARYRTLLQLAEKGVALPNDALVEPHTADTDRRRGVVLVSAGLGLIAMFLALPFEFHNGQSVAGLWGFGLLPLMTGAGYLAHWWLSRRDALHG